MPGVGRRGRGGTGDPAVDGGDIGEQGDSVIGRYAPMCAQVRACRTLRQIADFVQSLAVSSPGVR